GTPGCPPVRRTSSAAGTRSLRRRRAVGPAGRHRTGRCWSATSPEAGGEARWGVGAVGAADPWMTPPVEVGRYRSTLRRVGGVDREGSPSFTDRTHVLRVVGVSVVPPTVGLAIEQRFAGRRRYGDGDALGDCPAGPGAGRGEHRCAYPVARCHSARFLTGGPPPGLRSGPSARSSGRLRSFGGCRPGVDRAGAAGVVWTVPRGRAAARRSGAGQRGDVGAALARGGGHG